MQSRSVRATDASRFEVCLPASWLELTSGLPQIASTNDIAYTTARQMLMGLVCERSLRCAATSFTTDVFHITLTLAIAQAVPQSQCEVGSLYNASERVRSPTAVTAVMPLERQRLACCARTSVCAPVVRLVHCLALTTDSFAESKRDRTDRLQDMNNDGTGR